MTHIRTAFIDADVVIRKGRYHDGSTALALFDSTTGEMMAKATVCMSEYNLAPTNARHVFIKDYSENAGMFTALQEAGIIDEELRSLDAGWVHNGVREARVLDLDAIEDLP